MNVLPTGVQRIKWVYEIHTCITVAFPTNKEDKQVVVGYCFLSITGDKRMTIVKMCNLIWTDKRDKGL